MKRILLAIILILNLEISDAATPAWYGAASFIPGLGQTFNGNVLEGVTWFGVTLSLLGSKNNLNRNIGFDIWLYNMYDAWKDVGGRPSSNHWVGYEYAQSFNPAHLTDPFSIGALSLGAYGRGKSKSQNSSEDDLNVAQSILLFSFVGFGEESFFRGFLYPSFSSWLSPWGGAIVSSAAFSLAHVGASSEGNLVRFIYGLIFCWQYSHNKYQLGGNIFAHTWYDQILAGKMDINHPVNLKEQWRNPPLYVQYQIPID
jgi:membrane protease YdiL (CAAX protease family)